MIFNGAQVTSDQVWEVLKKTLLQAGIDADDNTESEILMGVANKMHSLDTQSGGGLKAHRQELVNLLQLED